MAGNDGMVRGGKTGSELSPLEQPGYRSGYGNRRGLTMSLGTIEIRPPGVRNLDERFIVKSIVVVQEAE